MVADVHVPRIALAVGAAAGPGALAVAVLGGIDPANVLVAVGLLGLAVEGGPWDAIARLADEVERLAAGAEDVDLPTDRDDEVGRLSEAIVGVADGLRGRESRADERYRREVHRITTDADAGGDEKVRRLLELGCERLDVDGGSSPGSTRGPAGTRS